MATSGHTVIHTVSADRARAPALFLACSTCAARRSWLAPQLRGEGREPAPCCSRVCGSTHGVAAPPSRCDPAHVGACLCVLPLQRVTAFHPKERHLSTGTVLTPDGDHYKVQFDRPKLGVQLVKDVFVMPLLDGSRGIDFTSPRRRRNYAP
eukprot:3490306-Pleurochrysis_carterae.AAC.1